jgi:excisionase family DNA binding protein
MNDSQLLRPEEVAARLNCSRSMAFLIISRGEIPHIRVGRLLRVRLEDLEMWISQQVMQGGLAASNRSIYHQETNPEGLQPLESKQKGRR